MIRKLHLTFIILVSACTFTFAQTGALKVKLIDKTNNETIPFANVVVELGGSQAGAGTTNMDGECIIKPLTPGKYNVKATYVGYQPFEITGVTVSSDKTSYVDIKMSAASINLGAVEIVQYKEPLIDPNTVSQKTVDREQYQNMATKNITSVAATSAGVVQSDEGKAVNMKGARSDGTAYYVDGQRMIGGLGVPQQGVEQITSITGGIPAQYGNITGGVISVTTRGPQSESFGAIEAISSQLTDNFGYNSLGFSWGGPLVMKKDTASGTKNAVLGFILSGQGTHLKDPYPSSIGTWKVKDDVLAELEKNPLRPSSSGAGYVKNSEFITKNQMEQIKANQNVASTSIVLNGKMDYKPVENINITLGGSMSYGNSNGFDYANILFNTSNNQQNISSQWNVYAKLTQKFGNAPDIENEKSSANIKNAYYTVLAGFTKINNLSQDADHKGNVFDYGYIGKFEQQKDRAYQFKEGSDSTKSGFYQTTFRDTKLLFQRAEVNPLAANYTSQFYNFVGADNVYTSSQVLNGQALLNGSSGSSVYSMWSNTGLQTSGYGYSNTNQFRVASSFSADIKNHAVQVGFEYEQTISRSFSVNPLGLWNLMRQSANFHIQAMDSSSATLDTSRSGTYNYYNYERLYNPNTQKQFDKSLREALGKNVTGTDFLDIDSYDPNTYRLDMFSADELLNSGNGIVSYSGYDYTGKKLNHNPTLDDFFTKKDANGDYTREIAPFQPIYVAGYIQDRFDFRDLKFNIGLRVDRYDANQKVLKDKYLLYETRTAGDDESKKLGGIPSNIGNDYVVYVNDIKSPTSIVGYRDGDTWYNGSGVEVSDPKVLALASTTGKISPYLVDPNNQVISSKAFKDYTPQVNLMPRIGFAFPISDVANFFAHYDVLTQSPGSGNVFNPTDYLFLQNAALPSLNNPALKPEKTIDYELGFDQILNEKKNSVIHLSAFYRETRDLIQLVQVNQAFPTSYLSFANIDFGTVKGLTIAYDLRRTGNVQLNANYTLSFAEGTGSSATSGSTLVNSGIPNLRTPNPLSYDQRHTINTTVDYRFGSGSDYDGPNWTRKHADIEKTSQLLANMGANFQISAGSGKPYSQQSNIIDEAVPNAGRTLKGSINGASLPWNVRMNLKIDKNILLHWGKKDGEKQKSSALNVYVQVLNLLNTKNILNVYRATGNPDDDGYLNTVKGQSAIAQATNAASYIDMYNIKLNSPYNFSSPRVIRIGATMNF